MSLILKFESLKYVYVFVTVSLAYFGSCQFDGHLPVYSFGVSTPQKVGNSIELIFSLLIGIVS